jgi:hypothetical protein
VSERKKTKENLKIAVCWFVIYSGRKVSKFQRNLMLQSTLMME